MLPHLFQLVTVPQSSSSTVPASQVYVTPSNASTSREFLKFSGDQDTVDSKSRAYIRKNTKKKSKYAGLIKIS